MAEIIEAEAQNSDVDRKKRRRKLKGKLKAKGPTPESEDDAEFLGSSSEGSTSSDEGDESDEVQISNKEVIPTLSMVYGYLIFFYSLWTHFHRKLFLPARNNHRKRMERRNNALKNAHAISQWILQMKVSL